MGRTSGKLGLMRFWKRKSFISFLTLTLIVVFGVRVATFAQRNVEPSVGFETSASHSTVSHSKKGTFLSVDVSAKPRSRDESNHLMTSVCPHEHSLPRPMKLSLLGDPPVQEPQTFVFSIPTPPPSCA